MINNKDGDTLHSFFIKSLKFNAHFIHTTQISVGTSHMSRPQKRQVIRGYWTG